MSKRSQGVKVYTAVQGKRIPLFRTHFLNFLYRLHYADGTTQNTHIAKSVGISGGSTMNGWVQNPCLLSTLARWPLWASNQGLSKVSVIGRCPS